MQKVDTLVDVANQLEGSPLIEGGAEQEKVVCLECGEIFN